MKKTTCFAFQNNLFCPGKQLVLKSEITCFAHTPNVETWRAYCRRLAAIFLTAPNTTPLESK